MWPALTAPYGDACIARAGKVSASKQHAWQLTPTGDERCSADALQTRQTLYCRIACQAGLMLPIQGVPQSLRLSLWAHGLASLEFIDLLHICSVK